MNVINGKIIIKYEKYETVAILLKDNLFVKTLSYTKQIKFIIFSNCWLYDIIYFINFI
jgi:hypothetical protein